MSKEAKLLIFGEVLFDCFEAGNRVLGGAPFNVAWGLHGLGQRPLLVSAVGHDTDGSAIRQAMLKWGLEDHAVQTHPSYATGKVSIWLEGSDARYKILHPRAWDAITDEGYTCTGTLYHGLLALREEKNQDTLHNLIARSPKAKRFFDINLRPPYDSRDLLEAWMQDSDWLKLNLEELAAIQNKAKIELSDAKPEVDQIRADFNISNVLLTAGSAGAMVSGSIGEAIVTPAPRPPNLVDTVGAGDAFSAFTLHGLIEGLSASDILEGAGRFAAKVCSLNGATSTQRGFYTPSKE